MKNIVINKGNIQKYGLNFNCNMASILGAVNHLIQNKSFSPFDCITDDKGVWYGVSHNEILKEIPILKLTKGTCQKYILDLINMGFIERHWNCERLSKTYLKPSQNFRLYFETDKNEIVINQNNCVDFDMKLSLIDWIVLKVIDKNTLGKFNSNFVFINETEILKELNMFFKSRITLNKYLDKFLDYGYIERSANYRIEKVYYYKAGPKYLEFKDQMK
ncbi:putative transcriptional regulator [Flavobacterium sp. CG_23.5]|uniref:hypothetical protein n=1 Tax=Flavobacterium sp. CG_23.5 TaxID=2760708 RepID=UPI001AE9F91F|nr:hypothetical protein [Flavobacterium sp. CG_23.5]MBP2283861.1 putative transcriptional regulator [Flavobacterium sp. CG_23.5]